MSFGNLLKEIRKEKKDSLRKLAEKIDMHFSYIDKIEKGITPPSKTFIEKIITIYPDSKNILMTTYLKESLPISLQTHDSAKVITNDNILNLPVYGKVSAGRGYINFDSPDYTMPIAKGAFSRRSFFVEVSGDSMSPTIEDGEFALVDPDEKEYIKNKIYVVTYDGESFIKRLEFKNKLNIVTLKSDNPEYEDIDIDEDSFEYFKIDGRVIKIISMKKV